jgi:hypothetical protein
MTQASRAAVVEEDGKAPGASRDAAAALTQVEGRKMVENQGRQRSRQQGIKVLERGDIYFIYRPKIGKPRRQDWRMCSASS